MTTPSHRDNRGACTYMHRKTIPESPEEHPPRTLSGGFSTGESEMTKPVQNGVGVAGIRTVVQIRAVYVAHVDNPGKHVEERCDTVAWRDAMSGARGAEIGDTLRSVAQREGGAEHCGRSSDARVRFKAQG
eukprot:gene12949-biopygen16979